MAKVTVQQRFKSVGAKLLLTGLAVSFFVGFLVVPNVNRFKGESGRGEETFAVINDQHKVTVREFLETYRQMEYRYQEQYGEQWDQLKSYFLPQVKTNSIDRIVFRYGAMDRAKELGLNVSDEEVRRLVHESPAFQDEGGVFRVNLYQQYLQRRHMSAEKFEDDLREDLIRQKLTGLFYDGVKPSRAQVEKEWSDRNTKIALEFVSVSIGELAKGQTVAGVCKLLAVSEQTYYAWRREYGGLKVDQAKRFKELEQENASLLTQFEQSLNDVRCIPPCSPILPLGQHVA